MKSIHIYLPIITGLSVVAAQSAADPTATSTSASTTATLTSTAATPSASVISSDSSTVTDVQTTTTAPTSITAQTTTALSTETTTPINSVTLGSSTQSDITTSTSAVSSTSTSTTSTTSTTNVITSTTSQTEASTSTSSTSRTNTHRRSSITTPTIAAPILPESTDASKYMSYAFPTNVPQPTWATGSYYTMLASALYSVDKSFVQRSDYVTILTAIRSAGEKVGGPVSVSMDESAWGWGVVTTNCWYQTAVPQSLQTEVVEYNSAWHAAASSVQALAVATATRSNNAGAVAPRCTGLALAGVAAGVGVVAGVM